MQCEKQCVALAETDYLAALRAAAFRSALSCAVNEEETLPFFLSKESCNTSTPIVQVSAVDLMRVNACAQAMSAGK